MTFRLRVKTTYNIFKELVDYEYGGFKELGRTSFDQEWEKIHSTQEWGQYPPEYVIRFMAKNYYKCERSNIRVLDFGCGAGANTWYLAREGFDTYAFDGSKSAVEKTEQKLARENLQAHTLISDALNLEYSRDFFDAIVDNVTIYANRIKDIEDMYKECYKFLKPGGRILSVCLGEETDGYSSGIAIEKGTYKDIVDGKIAHRGIAHIFSVEEIKALLFKIGFEEINVDTIIWTDNQVKTEQLVVTAIKK